MKVETAVCASCQGTRKCSKCSGTGSRHSNLLDRAWFPRGSGVTRPGASRKCVECLGTGTCQTCLGSGNR